MEVAAVVPARSEQHPVATHKKSTTLLTYRPHFSALIHSTTLRNATASSSTATSTSTALRQRPRTAAVTRTAPTYMLPIERRIRRADSSTTTQQQNSNNNNFTHAVHSAGANSRSQLMHRVRPQSAQMHPRTAVSIQFGQALKF